MVQIASNTHRSAAPEAGESSPVKFHELPLEAVDERLEDLIRKIVGKVIAQEAERAAESAVRRVLIATSERPRIVHDLTPVSELPLPTRIANALERMRIKTVAQLTAMREEEILSSPNLGERSLDQLKHVLGLFGRSLRGPQCLTDRIHDSTTDP